MPMRDVAAILEEETAKGAFPAVLHCFTGGAELARRGARPWALRLVLGHPDVQEVGSLREMAALVPLDRLLVETDAPYLAPGPTAASATSRPIVVQTAAELAKVKGISHGGAGPHHHGEFLPALQQGAARGDGAA